jgi:hypothetical protein
MDRRRHMADLRRARGRERARLARAYLPHCKAASTRRERVRPPLVGAAAPCYPAPMDTIPHPAAPPALVARIDLAYEGTHFHGWQVQPGGLRTVQGELVRALQNSRRCTDCRQVPAVPMRAYTLVGR